MRVASLYFCGFHFFMPLAVANKRKTVRGFFLCALLMLGSSYLLAMDGESVKGTAVGGLAAPESGSVDIFTNDSSSEAGATSQEGGVVPFLGGADQPALGKKKSLGNRLKKLFTPSCMSNKASDERTQSSSGSKIPRPTTGKKKKKASSLADAEGAKGSHQVAVESAGKAGDTEEGPADSSDSTDGRLVTVTDANLVDENLLTVTLPADCNPVGGDVAVNPAFEMLFEGQLKEEDREEVDNEAVLYSAVPPGYVCSKVEGSDVAVTRAGTHAEKGGVKYSCEGAATLTLTAAYPLKPSSPDSFDAFHVGILAYYNGEALQVTVSKEGEEDGDVFNLELGEADQNGIQWGKVPAAKINEYGDKVKVSLALSMSTDAVTLKRLIIVESSTTDSEEKQRSLEINKTAEAENFSSLVKTVECEFGESRFCNKEVGGAFQENIDVFRVKGSLLERLTDSEYTQAGCSFISFSSETTGSQEFAIFKKR